MKRISLALLALLALGTSAFAQTKVTVIGAGGGAATVTGGKLDVNATVTPGSGAGTVTSATVTTSSAQALATGTRKYLALYNESASVFVACNLGGTAVINGAGSITLAPYQSFTWEASFVPTAAVNCIAASGSQPFTIVSF